MPLEGNVRNLPTGGSTIRIIENARCKREQNMIFITF